MVADTGSEESYRNRHAEFGFPFFIYFELKTSWRQWNARVDEGRSGEIPKTANAQAEVVQASVGSAVFSFFFIAELIIDLELEPDGPLKDYCGTCSACIDECPTDAIPEPYVVDGSKCISYLTIELKDEIIPKEFHGKMDDWMFGCDICQDVCPWNRFSKPHNEPLFIPNENLLNLSKSEWQDLTKEVFQELFKKSAVKRTKLKGLKRNIDFLS